MSVDDFYRRSAALYQLTEQARLMEELARPYRAHEEAIARIRREIESACGPLRSATEQLSSFRRATDAALESYRQSLFPPLAQFGTASELAMQLVKQHRATMESYERHLRSAAIAPEIGSIMRQLTERDRIFAEAIDVGLTWHSSVGLLGTVRTAMDIGRAVREAIEQQVRLASLPDISASIRELTNSWEALTRSSARDALEAIYGRALVEQATIAAASHLSGSLNPAVDELRRASFLFDAISIIEQAEGFWDGSEAEESTLGSILWAILASVIDHLGRAKTRLEQESILTILAFVVALLAFVCDRLDSAGQDAAVRSMERGFVGVASQLDRLADAVEHQSDPVVRNAVRSMEGALAKVDSRVDRLVDAIERRGDPAAIDDDHRRLVVVLRNANVRELPSTKSKILDKLYPRQPAELVEALGDWFFVRYYDYLSGSTKSGWVYSKLVKRAHQRGEPAAD